MVSLARDVLTRLTSRSAPTALGVRPLMAGGDTLTELRTADRYVNATLLCKYAKKNLQVWKARKETDALLSSLAGSTATPKEALVQCKRGNHGTWMRQDVAKELAAWCGAETRDKLDSALATATAPGPGPGPVTPPGPVAAPGLVTPPGPVPGQSPGSTQMPITRYLQAPSATSRALADKLIRSSDGYFDATALCQAANKAWSSYSQNRSTQDFWEELERDTGIPVSQLIQVHRGGSVQGTWVHPTAAYHLAQWCSPQIALLVWKLVLQQQAAIPAASATPRDDANAQAFTQSLVAEDGSSIITEIRLKDGYVNATALCRAAGKDLYGYTRTG